jgi:hypothetical protein
MVAAAQAGGWDAHARPRRRDIEIGYELVRAPSEFGQEQRVIERGQDGAAELGEASLTMSTIRVTSSLFVSHELG